MSQESQEICIVMMLRTVILKPERRKDENKRLIDED